MKRQQAFTNFLASFNRNFNKSIGLASKRHNLFLERKEYNSFFLPLCFFSLNQYDLRDIEKSKVEEIKYLSFPILNRYKSKSDRPHFNFYPTDRTRSHFPNGLVLNRFKRFAPADDADVSALIYLAFSERFDKSQIHEFLCSLEHYSNHAHFDPLALKSAGSNRVFSTWTGTGIMPHEVDVCVLCNILSLALNFSYNSSTVIESMDYVKKVISSGYWLETPFRASRFYPFPSVILYHISRLYQARPGILSERLITTLKNQALTLLAHSNNFQKNIIYLSLAKLGLNTASSPESIELGPKLPFFTAPLLSGTENKVFNNLASWRLSHIDYSCETFSRVLEWEYEVLKK